MPTPQECAAMQAKIADLRQSYEDLLSGRKARVLVDQNGERIEFNAGNPRALLTYIQGIESEYKDVCGIARKPLSRPIRPFF